MLIREIKAFFKKNKCTTAVEISAALNIDKKLIEAALEFWINENKIRIIDSQYACKNCNKNCGYLPQNNPKIYEWIE